MIDKEKIAENFDPKTLVEDVELSVICAIRGIKIAYIEEAITYDEQPVDLKTSWNQRRRWTIGMMQCGKLYRGKLMGRFFRKGDLSCIDKCLFTLGPSMQVFSFVLNIVAIIFQFTGVQFHTFYTKLFSLGLIGTVVFYIIGVLINAFVIKFYKRSVWKSMHGILLFTVFVATWIPINALCLFKKNKTWTPVKHNSKSNIKNIMMQK